MIRIKEIIFRAAPAFRVVFIMIWLSNLALTDSYFSVYCLLAFLSFYVLIKKTGKEASSSSSMSFLSSCLAVLFSIVVVAANYPLFSMVRDPALIGKSTNLMVNFINTVFSLIGGFCVAQPLISFALSYCPLQIHREKSIRNRILPVIIFGAILCIYMVHFILVEFPGNITEDPFTQISEMVAGEYSNFNTFWHTMFFQMILSLGYTVFSDINYAIGCFCIVQAFILAFSFSYCLMTMLHYGVPRWVLAVSFCFFALVPYNIALSITIWKDVLYAAGCLLIIVSWLRIHKKLGFNQFLDYTVFVIGSILFLLSRTNGWIIYIVCLVCYILFIRNNRRFMLVMSFVAVLGWFLCNPVLSILGVSDSDPVESLSIPIQQVSRVISDGGVLTEEEEQLLSRVIDLDDVPELYTNWLSDPMKVEFRSKDYVYLCDHLTEYGSLWLKLGVRYPVSYIKAWIDQTKGYWNGGYDVALYSETVTDNPYGVEKLVSGNPVASLFRLYFGMSRHVIFFEPLHSIGLHVWVVILCFIRNLLRKREEWFLALPALLIVLGLWFGTPVYYCFRYVYPLFVSFPLIVSTSMFSDASY